MNESQAVYERWHSEQEVDANIEAIWHQAIVSHLDQQRDVAGCRVLELGCGRGGFSCYLSKCNPPPSEVIAGDFSQAAITKGREYADAERLSNIRWRLLDIQKIDEADESFDTVFSFETIEHVPDPAKAVAELARVLKPGGRLYLTTPNYLSSIGLYRAYCWVAGKTFDEGGQPICHITTLPSTRRWIRAAGLTISYTDSIGHFLPIPGRPPIRIKWLESPRLLMRWFGIHSVVIANKPLSPR